MDKIKRRDHDTESSSRSSLPPLRDVNEIGVDGQF